MKRFYDTTSIDETADGFRVLLDGKPLNTPAKNPVLLPNKSMAEAVAAEWEAQDGEIDKSTLPLTGYTSLTLDIMAIRRKEVIAELLEYGETDLLFYREGEEEELETRQREQWQPWLDWAQLQYGTRYQLTSGVMPIAQPKENKPIHAKILNDFSNWKLALFAGVLKPTTSLILSLAFLEKALNAKELFELSRLEENFNRDKWGIDTEAKVKADQLAYELRQAEIWRDLLP